MISLTKIYPKIKEIFGSEINLTDFKNIDDDDLNELCQEISLSLREKMKLKSIIRQSRNNSNNNNNNNTNSNDKYSKYSKYSKHSNQRQGTTTSEDGENSKKNSDDNIHDQEWIDRYNYRIGDAGRRGNEDSELNKQLCRYNLKMIFLGKGYVGKTSILRKFAFNTFDENSSSTLEDDKVETVVYTNNDEAVFLEIWDTVGQERYKSLTRQYFRGADCAIIVYDITNSDSFNCIENDYISQIQEKCDQNDMCIMLVGNKIDLENQRQISTEAGKNLANKHGYGFCEVSAKSGSHIYPLLRACAQRSITMQSNIIVGAAIAGAVTTARIAASGAIASGDANVNNDNDVKDSNERKEHDNTAPNSTMSQDRGTNRNANRKANRKANRRQNRNVRRNTVDLNRAHKSAPQHGGCC